jgi:hypothetical protein
VRDCERWIHCIFLTRFNGKIPSIKVGKQDIKLKCVKKSKIRGRAVGEMTQKFGFTFTHYLKNIFLQSFQNISANLKKF